MAALVVHEPQGTGRWAVTLTRVNRRGNTIHQATQRVGSRTLARALKASFEADPRTLAVRVQDGA